MIGALGVPRTLESSETEVAAGIAVPFKSFNMIGSENGRVQIICIGTGMKEIDGGRQPALQHR